MNNEQVTWLALSGLLLLVGLGGLLARRSQVQRDRLELEAARLRTALADAQARLAVLSRTSEAMAEVCLDGTVVPVTSAFARFVPKPVEGAQVRWADIFAPEHQGHLDAMLERVRSGASDGEELECAPTVIGSGVRWCLVTLRPLGPHDVAGRVPALLAVRDLTEVKELRLLRTLGGVVMDHIDQAVVTLHGDDDTVAWANPAFQLLSGWPREQVRGRSLGDLMKSTAVGDPMPSTLELVEAEGVWSGEFRSVTAAGDLLLEERRVLLVEDEVANSTRRVVVFRNLTSEVATQEHLRVLMQVDVATELPNLYGFLSSLRVRLLDAQGPNRLSVVNLDFHGCAAMRESQGTVAVDCAMRSIAALLSRALKEDNMLSRVGAAQLALVVPSTNLQSIETVLRAMTMLLKSEAGNQQSDVFTAVSIGVAPGGQGVSAENLLHAAQVTSAELDPSSGVNLGYFSEQLQAELGRRLQVESALRDTLRERPHELLLHYQPKVDPYKQRLVGFEALCRWNHPKLGPVPPGEFVPAAERSGLIIALGDRTFEMACQALAGWRNRGLPLRPIAVNVSAHQLTREALATELLAQAQRYDIPTRLLELEVTESAVMRDIAHAAGQLKRLRAAGFAIALDDFGTGQSSLAYLRTLPLDALKIDRSFISDIETRPDAAAICKSILELGRTLHLKVIAEGVETPGQLKFLMENRCDVVQGWVISKAVPAEEAANMLDELSDALSTMTAVLHA